MFQIKGDTNSKWVTFSKQNHNNVTTLRIQGWSTLREDLLTFAYTPVVHTDKFLFILKPDDGPAATEQSA